MSFTVNREDLAEMGSMLLPYLDVSFEPLLWF